MSVLFSFLLLSIIFTTLMGYMPTYPENDWWGKMLNNFIYFVIIYLAARWAMRVEKVAVKR
jgi:hypothetical protein